MEKEKARTYTTIRFPNPSLKKDLETLAKKDNRSLNSYMCSILEKHVAEQKDKSS